MKVLVTGSAGRVGSVVARDLRTRGHEVVDFDRSEGRDIEDLPALTTASVGCDGVIHAAALLGLPNETPEEIMRVNVQGTWNVLSAAQTAGVARVVSLSSVDALGLFKGERTPDYLPLDDEHRCYPATPYAISKRLGEEMCRFFAASSGTAVICLRPPGVWEPDTYGAVLAARAERPSFEWNHSCDQIGRIRLLYPLKDRAILSRPAEPFRFGRCGNRASFPLLFRRPPTICRPCFQEISRARRPCP